jgi:hypothetical protein
LCKEYNISVAVNRSFEDAENIINSKLQKKETSFILFAGGFF